ncbi:hypothetical protein Tco_0360806 [Tanacetum coccineum]
MKVPHQGINNDNQSRQFGNQRTMTVAGARETLHGKDSWRTHLKNSSSTENKQNEFEKYKAFNDRMIDYEILQTKLNETLGLLALKDIEIKEGLKTKAYEISVLNQKHDELVKKSLLTKSQLEGYLKENTKVISGFKGTSEAQSENPVRMRSPYDTLLILLAKIAPDREETLTLDQESRSKLKLKIMLNI